LEKITFLISEDKGIVLNSVEKKSFYSFLSLYLGSSLIFVLLSGYWYYSAQKNTLESMTYYKMQHIADTISSLIINAHMMNEKLQLPLMDEEGFSYELVPIKNQDIYKEGYFEKDGFKILVSASPQEHLMIKYVVIKTDRYDIAVTKLQKKVLSIILLIFGTIMIISWVLSKLFMRPIREKIEQIEHFIQDISHELNTPITALTMSSKRALQKKVYDEKTLKNISISTKQLYSIYKSLTYLSFSSKEQEVQNVELAPILLQSLEYYRELLEAKNIKIHKDLEDASLIAIDTRVELLFSNLISNAIKYSLPSTEITVTLKKNYFSIEDQGVGIAPDKLNEIFKIYERNSNLAGGFGVGLHIVQQICDEFKITIQVESQLQKGSKFILQW